MQVEVVMQPMPEQHGGAPGRPPHEPSPRERPDESVLEGVGVRVSAIDARLGRRLGLEQGQGVVITSVDRGSPAAEAGLKVGDVILVLGTTRVTGVGQLRTLLGNVEPGELISLVVLSDGETRFVDLRRGR